MQREYKLLRVMDEGEMNKLWEEWFELVGMKRLDFHWWFLLFKRAKK